MSYKAIVGRVRVRPHPNADRLKLGLIFGNQVVVGADTSDGELMLFFPTDGQLSPEFAEANHLVRRTDPSTGKPSGGFFEENRRVRAQRFRGEKSDGFACPLSYLAWTGGDITKLEDGEQLDTFRGKLLCTKYETPATKVARAAFKQAKKERAIEAPALLRHFDTDQFRYNARRIPIGALVTVTEKLHGTSERYGHTEVTRYKYPHKLLRLIGFGPKRTKAFEHVVGTRNTLLLGDKEDPFYGENGGFRFNVLGPMAGNLYPGETVYFEVVGFDDGGAPIMNPHGVEDPKLRNKYGEMMVYSYGCLPGTCAAYIYRITRTDLSGRAVELPWWQVAARAAELGVDCVPTLAQFIHESEEQTCSIIEALGGSEVPSILDQRHIREGVCVRVEHREMFTILKHKSFLFGVLEGYLKDNGNLVDREEAA